MNSMSKKQNSITLSSLYQLQALHQNMSDQCNRISTLLSKTLFFLYLFFIIDLTNYSLIFLKFLSDKNSFSKENFINGSFYQCFRVSHLLILFCLLSYFICKLSERSCKAYRSLHRMSINVPDNDQKTFILQMMTSFKNHLRKPTVVFTAWRIFVIDKSFIFNILGAIVSYVVVLTQMTTK